MKDRSAYSRKPFFALFALSVSAMMAVDAYAGCNSNPSPGVDWSDCRKRNLILSDNDLTKANMRGAELISTDLRHAKLDGANLVRTDLLRTVFDGASMVGVDFSKAAGYRSQFVKTNLTDTNFDKSEMQRANFSASTLRNVNFAKASLGRAMFKEATIDNVNFEFSILARADFRGATLSGKVDFTNAFVYLTRFENVDLGGATGLVQSQIDMSCGNAGTVLPDGLQPSASWPCADEE